MASEGEKGIDNNESKEKYLKDVLCKPKSIVKKVEGEILSIEDHNRQMQALAIFEKKHNFIKGESSSDEISNETDSKTAFSEIGGKSDANENIKCFTILEQLNEFTFKSCKKVAPLDVLFLTQDEVNKRRGKIETLEGDLPLNQGDYLARGINGEEWPIKRENFVGYQQIGEPNKEGFITYNPPAVKRGYVQINEPFKLQIPGLDFLEGKAGDYMIREYEIAWLIDWKIFEKTYQVSEEIYQPNLTKKETKE